MEKLSVSKAKGRLDELIKKQRVALYKPIQIAEILFHGRQEDLTLEEIRSNLEGYRNTSKRWRDEITKKLIDRTSTSSQRYQDDLFTEDVIPPRYIAKLSEENIRYPGVVERYIYQKFGEKQERITHLSSFLQSDPEDFYLEHFLKEFVYDSGIKRSIDKAFEIVVYALFHTVICQLKIHVIIEADSSKMDLLKEFGEFTRAVLGIDHNTPRKTIYARLFRAGVTNAADRGLDIWANFGPAIQVKHLSLTEEQADDVVDHISADNIIIVCRDAEKKALDRVLSQMGQRIQSIVVQSQLVEWYNIALRGVHSDIFGAPLMKNLRLEFENEFPYTKELERFYKERGYDQVTWRSSIFGMPD